MLQALITRNPIFDKQDLKAFDHPRTIKSTSNAFYINPKSKNFK